MTEAWRLIPNGRISGNITFKRYWQQIFALPDKIPTEAICRAIDEKRVRVAGAEGQLERYVITRQNHYRPEVQYGAESEYANRLTSGIAGYLVADDTKDL